MIYHWERWQCPIINAILINMRHFFHHLFIPRESNKHRARILHHDSLLLIITFMLFTAALFSTVQNNFPMVLGITANISINDLVNLTNQDRAENNVGPLRLNAELSQAATAKAADMFAHDYWAHIDPDTGATPWVFIKNAGYNYLYAGENLARGYTTAPDVISAWMASPEHRANMLSPNYTDVGFAVATGPLTGSETVLVVEEFGSPYETPNQSTSSDQTGGSLPSPTPNPNGSVLQSQQPTPTFAVPNPQRPQGQSNSIMSVAALRSEPLFDGGSTGRGLGIFLILLFIVVFAVDAIIIERKQIVRVVSHNVDHIIFLFILLCAAILLGHGVVL